MPTARAPSTFLTDRKLREPRILSLRTLQIHGVALVLRSHSEYGSSWAMCKRLVIVAIICILPVPGCERSRRQEITARVNALVVDADTNVNLESALTALLHEAASGDSFTKMKAVNGIGRIAEKHGLGEIHAKVVESLGIYLECDDSYVRRESALALLRVEDDLQMAISPLMEAVRRREPVDSAWFAAEALGNLGSDGRIAIPVLREAANGEDDHLAAIAAKSLEKLENTLP